MQYIKCYDCSEIDELVTATQVWNVREPTHVPDYLCEECFESKQDFSEPSQDS